MVVASLFSPNLFTQNTASASECEQTHIGVVCPPGYVAEELPDVVNTISAADVAYYADNLDAIENYLSIIGIGGSAAAVANNFASIDTLSKLNSGPASIILLTVGVIGFGANANGVALRSARERGEGVRIIETDRKLLQGAPYYESTTTIEYF